MPTRLCANPACPNPAIARGRCELHAKQLYRETQSRYKPLYNSKKWRLTRRHQLAQHPLCEQCGRIATDVHHRTDLDDGGQPFAFANLQSLCHECHGQVTRQRMMIAA